MEPNDSNSGQPGCCSVIVILFATFCFISMYRGCTTETPSTSSNSADLQNQHSPSAPTPAKSPSSKANQSKDIQPASAFESEIEEIYLASVEEYNNKISDWNIAIETKKENEERLLVIQADLEQLEKQKPRSVSFEERTWTTFDFRFTTKAILQAIDSTNVTLLKPDGNEVSVNREKLSEADAFYLKRAAEDLEAYETALGQWDAEKQLMLEQANVLRQKIELATSKKPVEPTMWSVAGEIEEEREKKKQLEEQAKADKTKQASGSGLGKQRGLGVSDRQISKLIGKHFTPLVSTTAASGKPSRLSLAFDKGATIELIGDPNDVSTVTLLFETPKDQKIMSLSNISLCALLLFECLPDWPQSFQWLSGAFQRVSVSTEDEPSEDVTIGKATVAISYYKYLDLYRLTIQCN